MADPHAEGRPHAAAAAGSWGLLAEFDDVPSLVQACEAVRDAGYARWDAHTPFPVHGLNDAMGLRPTRLPWLVLVGGVVGAAGALLLQWWTNAVDYPYNISGKPLFSLPANIPVTFEGTILVAALCAFFGMLVLNGLPTWYHPLLRSERFRRTTADRFFISIQASDPRFHRERTRGFLESLGATHVEPIED